MEQWKSIEGYDGRYEISNYGQVRTTGKSFISYNQCGAYRRTMKKSLLKWKVVKNGYAQVGLRHPITSKRTFHLIHRLVLAHFKPHPDQENLQCNHLDHNKLNNRVDNLEWCTGTENKQHSAKHGYVSRGEKHPKAVLTDKIVRKIRSLHGKMSIRNIGKQLGVDYRTVGDVLRKRTWKHI